jgi:murein DD-endopeptidase MepM/ murein hydrolase activator NlpD
MLTPIDDQTLPSPTPLTRRHLREAERAELAARRHRGRSSYAAAPRVHAVASAPRPVTAPAPVIGVAPAAAVSAAAAGTRASSRSVASKGLTALAMGFVATVTVATSLPANALYSPDEVLAAPTASATYASPHTVAGQSVTVPDGKMETVVHDTYTVQSYEEVELAQSNAGVGTFANDPNGTIQWPFIVGVPISGVFGHRTAPCSNGCSSDHKGVDFAPGMGAPVQAIADGVVRYAEESDFGLGVHVIIDHMIDGHLVSSVYGHMQFGSLKVAQGQTVKVGDQLGGVGSTGASTGPHLHLEVHLEDGTPVDPYAWLKAHAN